MVMEPIAVVIPFKTADWLANRLLVPPIVRLSVVTKVPVRRLRVWPILTAASRLIDWVAVSTAAPPTVSGALFCKVLAVRIRLPVILVVPPIVTA